MFVYGFTFIRFSKCAAQHVTYRSDILKEHLHYYTVYCGIRYFCKYFVWYRWFSLKLIGALYFIFLYFFFCSIIKIIMKKQQLCFVLFLFFLGTQGRDKSMKGVRRNTPKCSSCFFLLLLCSHQFLACLRTKHGYGRFI